MLQAASVLCWRRLIGLTFDYKFEMSDTDLVTARSVVRGTAPLMGVLMIPCRLLNEMLSLTGVPEYLSCLVLIRIGLKFGSSSPSMCLICDCDFFGGKLVFIS